MLSIFSPEISSLESQVDALQAQIVAAQERINQLGECEVTAAAALQALQGAVSKIAGLAPDAIAGLKASVLNLFNSGDGGSQVEQPVSDGPSPLTPADANREQHDVRRDVVCQLEQHAIGHAVVLPEQLVASAVKQVSDTQPAGGPELNGQSCQMEDYPAESLRGQVYELCCPIKQNVVAVFEEKHTETAISEPVSINKDSDIAEAQDLFELVKLSDTVAYIKRSSDGEILCCYLGGSNKQTLKAWGEWLCLVHSVGTKFELRTAQRLTQFKHELKIWGLSLTQIQRLAESDTMKRPPSNFGTAPKRQPERVPSDLQIDNYKPGDVIRSATVRNWRYKVLEVRQDGLIECQRIDVDAIIKATLSPASIELVARAAVVEGLDRLTGETEEQAALNSLQQPLPAPVTVNLSDVPSGVTLTSTRDDLVTAYDAWMWAEVRIFGKPQHQNKQIGRLVETIDGIQASRPRGSNGRTFSRTLDAVSFLISGSGLKPIPTAKEPVLVGAVSVDDDDF